MKNNIILCNNRDRSTYEKSKTSFGSDGKNDDNVFRHKAIIINLVRKVEKDEKTNKINFVTSELCGQSRLYTD